MESPFRARHKLPRTSTEHTGGDASNALTITFPAKQPLTLRLAAAHLCGTGSRCMLSRVLANAESHRAVPDQRNPAIPRQVNPPERPLDKRNGPGRGAPTPAGTLIGNRSSDPMHDRTNPSPLQVMPPATGHDRAHRWERQPSPIPPAMTPAPWTTAGHDLDQAVTELNNRFPDAMIWFGDFTGSFWALIRAEDGAASLIEGVTSADLSRRLDSRKPWPPDPNQSPPPAAVHWNNATSTPCPATAAHSPSARRSPRGRNKCRGRHSVPRRLGRSGRC